MLKLFYISVEAIHHKIDATKNVEKTGKAFSEIRNLFGVPLS